MSGGVAADEDEQWPAVLLPVDRPRRAGRAPCCTALASLPRDSLPPVSDQFLLDCFAALLFRYTRQDRISVVWGARSYRYLITGKETVAGLTATAGPAPGAEQGREFRLDLTRQAIELHYDPALYDPATADQLLAQLRTLASDAAGDRNRPIELLNLLSAAEQRTVLTEWNQTGRRYDDQALLHTGFEKAASRQPAATAVLWQGRRFSYAEVGAAANRLAHHLRERGIGPDVRVGLYLERSPNLLIGMLAVLKAGGAFVPLDPHHPRARLATLIAGSDCALLLTDSRLAGSLDAGTVPLLLLDRDAPLLAGQPATDPEPLAGPEHLCYIISTSGSTGTPKAIALRHRGVVNNLDDLISRFGIGPADSVLALSSPGFDMSIFEFLGVTATGGTVVIPDPDLVRDPAHWARLIATEGVTIWNSAPALLGLLTDQLEQDAGPARLGSLRLALLGGDWVPLTLPGRARRASSPGLRVIVMGGATEASIHSTLFEVEDVDPAWTSIPYGRPMANQRAYLLDEAGQPVPPGVAGELHLAGTGLARGYLGQPELTADRFFEWSFGPVRSERLYRTGDLARYGRDGMIELLGRIDFQVKINGQRIELGEIEAVLAGHPGVQQIALAARENQLVAYVVATDVTADQLIGLATERLPAYMVPARVVVLDRLPLSPNGKVDRAALPAPDSGRAPWRAAGSTAERVLAGIVAELLGTQEVGVDDDFLSLGGDSVRAIQLVSRAKARGVVVTAAQVLGLRTIAAIAAAAGTGSEPAPPPEAIAFDLVEEADRAELARRYPTLAELWPMTPLQSGMLFELMFDGRRDGPYRQQTIIELTGAPDADRVREACTRLVARHASLRTAFVCDLADDPVQVVLDHFEPPWRHVELTDLEDADRDRALSRVLRDERESLPELDCPPLLRFALITVAAGHAVLVLTAYHLLYDGWSERLLARELAELYAGIEPAPAGDFRDYLHWLGRQDRAAGIRAWQAQLAGFDRPTLLSPGPDLTEPAELAEHVVDLGSHELVPGRRLPATRSAVAQAAWALVLAELTGRDDVAFGITVSGRPGELPGVETMVGMLINTIPLRVRVDPDQSVARLFTRLAATQVELLAHEYLGLADIHEAVGVARLFDTLLVCQSFPAAGPGNDALGIGAIRTTGVSNYPLTLLVEADRLVVQYDVRCHGHAQVVALVDRFRELAGQLIDAAGGNLGALPRAGLPGHAEAPH